MSSAGGRSTVTKLNDGPTLKVDSPPRGKTSPDAIAEELAADAAVRAADTLLLTVPNQLGVDSNAKLPGTVVRHIAPAIGWAPKARPERPPKFRGRLAGPRRRG